jgi:hypothetical protein
MKKLILFALVAVTSSYTAPVKRGITPEERKFALDYFQKTKDRFLKDVKGLSEAQLSFKADTSRWSVAQCIEHIALAESLLWQWTQGMLKQPAAPEKRTEIKYTNEKLIASTIDRSAKFKAPEQLQPVGKFPSTAAALQAYTARRDSTMAYVATTTDDLKNHFIVHPVFGTLDIYQAMLLLAAHSERHTLQIEEVMANPNFPKK